MYGGLRHNFVSSRDLFLNLTEKMKKTTYAPTQSTQNIDRKYQPEVGADP